MSNRNFSPNLFLDETRTDIGTPRPGVDEIEAFVHAEPIVPAEIKTWLARLRLLEAVPFAYLVPDSALLPLESIRFFYIDRAWTDALVQGALSVGTVNSMDRAQLEQLHARIRFEVDCEERRVRMPGGEEPSVGPAGAITGFLLRSRAVSGWPGLHVRAYREEVGDEDIIDENDPRRIKLLRLERLAPAVLLALFDGIPDSVHIEEPHAGIQFGVQLDMDENRGCITASVPARDVQNGNYLHLKPPSDESEKEKYVPPEDRLRLGIRFRADAPGVLDLTTMEKIFLEEKRTNMANIGETGAAGDDQPRVDSAEFALQMLRFPYRQVFGEVEQTAAEGDLAHNLYQPTTGNSLLDIERHYINLLDKERFKT